MRLHGHPAPVCSCGGRGPLVGEPTGAVALGLALVGGDAHVPPLLVLLQPPGPGSTPERARRFKTSSFTSYDAFVDTLAGAGTMTGAQVQDLITVALGLRADLWPGRVP
ncbi:hypothetical protein ACPCUK_16930 [Streptomyces arboris]|uniref:hypothetical protein n=1 Tax=Streptomyces arboris TaxID=2600619 RepID=UPI003C2F7FDC